MSKSKPELKLVEDTGSQLQDEDLSIELPPQQSEMPFAVVEGEPMTQLPRDLYIPPDALQVFLTAFEGPLDLLLYLIRKQNLDILNIPIAEITRQYMQYIEVMAEMQLELAGEYLLMAAMLAEIKSRMLLPRPPVAEGQEEEDPRAELVRRLQEYERFKKAAEDIDRLARLERDTMPASAELEERKIVTRPPDVTLKEMLDAFRDVLSRAEKFAHHHISRERLSQRERMTEILSRLQTVAFFEFTQLFKIEEGRMGVTVTFIAILELMKEGLIEIVQAEAYAPIHVRTAQRHLKVVQGGAAAEQADAENVAALSQPELAGENDIPEEFDDEPAADEAAVAVEAAVADVAAASSIAVDSVESDAAAADAGFVEAAVSEALASTESAVDTIATEEAAEIEASAVIEAPVAETEAIVDESRAADALDTDVFVDVADAATADAAAGAAESGIVEEHVAAAHVVEQHTVEEHAVPEHVVDVATDGVEAEELVADATVDEVAAASDPAEDVAADILDEVADDVAIGVDEVVVSDEAADAVPDEVLEAYEVTDAVADEGVAADEVGDVAGTEAGDVVEILADARAEDEASAALLAAEAHVVEEHVIEEHEIEEHVVPEHVIEEHVVAEPLANEESASLAAFEIETPVESVAEGETAEIADADVASDDFPATEVVAEHAEPLETIEVAVEGAAAVEMTNVVIDDEAQSATTDAAESSEQSAELTEQDGELSVDDDTVTGSSSEADNSDAEPSR